MFFSLALSPSFFLRFFSCLPTFRVPPLKFAFFKTHIEQVLKVIYKPSKRTFYHTEIAWQLKTDPGCGSFVPFEIYVEEALKVSYKSPKCTFRHPEITLQRGTDRATEGHLILAQLLALKRI
jgi:hypothetical protein